MNVRLALCCAFALLAVPVFPACSGGSSSNGTPGASDAGPQGSEDSGSGSTGPTAGGGETGSDAGGSSASPDAGGGTTPGGGDDSGGTGAIDASPDVGAVGIPAVKAVMYLDNWSGTFASWATQIDFTKMTHLILAFATVSGTNSWGNSLGDTGDVQTLAAAAHAKGVKVLASIGGGGGDQTVISAYQSASNIAPLVANLDTMVSAMNLDGVDVDLESPNDMTPSSNYSAFVSALISTFHPEGKLVTTATAEYIVQGQNADATTYATLNSFDFINDMIYSANLSDFTNEAGWWAGSPVNLPNENLVWGICFDGGGECANPSVSVTQQITTGSLAYGGVMVWDYTDSVVGATMWPAIQSEL
jgi:Glycosyl hydrolases family 18